MTVPSFSGHDLKDCLDLASNWPVLDSFVSSFKVVPHRCDHTFQNGMDFLLSVSMEIDVMWIAHHGLFDKQNSWCFGEFSDQGGWGSFALISGKYLLSDSHKLLALISVSDFVQGHMEDLTKVVKMFDFRPELRIGPILKLFVNILKCFLSETQNYMSSRWLDLLPSWWSWLNLNFPLKLVLGVVLLHKKNNYRKKSPCKTEILFEHWVDHNQRVYTDMSVFFMQLFQGVFGLLLIVNVENSLIVLLENYGTIVWGNEQILLSQWAVSVLLLVLKLVDNAALDGLLFFVCFDIFFRVWLSYQLNEDVPKVGNYDFFITSC